jgi:GT2 family glycosyltransferase
MTSNSDISNPLISIIIPTKGNLKLLKACVESIAKSSYKNYEVIIVDNSKKEEARKLGGLKYAVFFYDEPFNFAKINNFAVQHARGEHVVFLNDDTQVISLDWMEKMLEHSLKPNVGAVGALLFYLNDTIQHAGVLIGVGGITSHAFEGLSRNDSGYKGLVQTVRECSAVTGACMMTKKSLFQQVGGFDENFAYSFNDIDLCLRLREKGYLIMYTPHVQLYHHGTASRTYNPDNKEVRNFIKRWHDLILKGDLYYDQNLSRVNPFVLKMSDEKLVLTDTRLVEEVGQVSYIRFGKYVKILNKIRKHHGTRRAIIEFLRFLKMH